MGAINCYVGTLCTTTPLYFVVFCPLCRSRLDPWFRCSASRHWPTFASLSPKSPIVERGLDSARLHSAHNEFPTTPVETTTQRSGCKVMHPATPPIIPRHRCTAIPPAQPVTTKTFRTNIRFLLLRPRASSSPPLVCRLRERETPPALPSGLLQRWHDAESVLYQLRPLESLIPRPSYQPGSQLGYCIS